MASCLIASGKNLFCAISCSRRGFLLHNGILIKRLALVVTSVAVVVVIIFIVGFLSLYVYSNFSIQSLILCFTNKMASDTSTTTLNINKPCNKHYHYIYTLQYNCTQRKITTLNKCNDKPYERWYRGDRY